jgi:hypothetical protein
VAVGSVSSTEKFRTLKAGSGFGGIQKVLAANRDLVAQQSPVMGHRLLHGAELVGQQGDGRLAQALHITVHGKLDVLQRRVVDLRPYARFNLVGLLTSLGAGHAEKQRGKDQQAAGTAEERLAK